MAWSSMWDEVFSSREWGKYPAESLIRFVARNFYSKERKNIRILEVGCGPGSNVWYIAREGFKAFGIDGSIIAIDKAKKRLESEKLDANLEVGDVVNLKYDDQYFDAVIDVECLYCNDPENTEKILKEINRVLKPNGLLYSRTFSTDVYLGQGATKINELEFKNIQEGPLAGNVYARLSNRESIKSLYGKFFTIISIDKEEYTVGNGQALISEWSAVCRKEGSE